jgi:coronin-1B/1C/6
MSSGEWFDGKTALPPLISLKTRYEGGGDDSNELSAEEKAEIGSSSTTAPVTSTPAPTKTESAPAPKPAPAPVQQQGEIRTELKDNKKAMADMADKFADKEVEEDEEDSDDSFEEVPKPVERPIRAAAPAAADPVKPTSASAPTPAMASFALPTSSTPKPSAAPTITAAAEPTRATPASITAPSGPAEVLKNHLTDIKSAQANTSSEIAELRTQVGDLTELVKTLNGRLDALVGSQAERMRRIELEVEELRE